MRIRVTGAHVAVLDHKVKAVSLGEQTATPEESGSLMIGHPNSEVLSSVRFNTRKTSFSVLLKPLSLYFGLFCHTQPNLIRTNETCH